MKYVLKFLLFVVLVVLVVIGIDTYVRYSANTDIYNDISKVPPKRAALVLGTAKHLGGGRKNYFYIYRMRAAISLWKAGKIKAIIVSGDNGSKYYDETTTMQQDLIKAGIPKHYITLDYAGFRTLDSIIRAEAIFDIEDYIIISQRFHLERALFIARAKGQQAIGFVAKDIPGTVAAYRMKFREYLARTKAFLDVYILRTDPKFYGDKVKVNYRSK